MSPRISVVIPAYNGARLLPETIRSVLAQDHPDVELIVVDDESPDDTSAVVRRFPTVRLIRQANGGTGAARNTGVAAATGSFLAFLDQDDLWAPTKLSRQLAWLEERGPEAIGLCRQVYALEAGMEPPRWLHPKLRSEHSCYTPSGWLMRRAVFERVGPFDASFDFGADFDWLFRARDLGIELTVVPELLLTKRIHAINLSHRVEECKRDLLRIVRESVRRKRTGG